MWPGPGASGDPAVFIALTSKKGSLLAVQAGFSRDHQRGCHGGCRDEGGSPGEKIKKPVFIDGT